MGNGGQHARNSAAKDEMPATADEVRFLWREAIADAYADAEWFS